LKALLYCSLLLGNRAEFRFGEKVGAFFMQTFSFVFQGNLKNIRRLKVKLVAKAMFKIAQRNDTGFKIYESDAIQEIGKVLNCKILNESSGFLFAYI
jgi:hypothetical protein